MLTQANAALQAGEADKALTLLAATPASGEGAALTHNLICRVRYMLGQWDAAAPECQRAVQLDGQSSDYHMWLARAWGERASSASFLNAFSLAKQSRAEFEEAVRLNPRNAPALADLGDFYSQAPGVVGGGVDKAQQIAAQLEKIDPPKAHHLRAEIAEQQKDYAGAEREFKQAIAASSHPALEWTSLASFYSRRKQYAELEAAIQSVLSLAVHDKYAAVAFFDGASVLIRAKRDPAVAATLLSNYLASPNKSEEAPAFIAHLMMARVKAMLGDTAAASRERSAALAMANEYKPAQNFKPSDPASQEANL
jgi:tetratricopeptide (TPR) repeat protein